MDDWFRSWVMTHCHAFGITGADQIGVFVSWRAALIGIGATGPELADATQRCLMDEKTPEWPRDHLVAIKRHLGAIKETKRKEAARTAATSDSRRGVCTYCGDTGLICGMPYPADVRGGEWHPARHNHVGEPVYRTCAVWCSCPKGKRHFEGVCGMEETVKKYGRPYSLESYERNVDPAWKEHIAEREAAEKALCKAHEHADGLSRIIASITAKVGKGREAAA